MDSPQPNRGVAPAAVIVALTLVYLSWGTTYLAIREGVQYFPPALFGGTRVGLAGVVLLGFLALRGAPLRLSGGRLLWLAFVGVILFVGGNGLMTLAEKTVESGEASLLAATTPLWMALFETIRPRGERLTLRGWLGLAAGLAGMMLIVPMPENWTTLVLNVGPFLVLASAVAWATGSCLLRLRPTEGSPFVEAGYQMLFGGFAMTLIGLAAGEHHEITTASFTVVSVWAFFHLLVFGSLVGFVAFTWLLNNTSAALAGTCSYVNPVVAVLLGWAIAGERLPPWALIGMAVILASVALVRSGLAQPDPFPASPSASEIGNPRKRLDTSLKGDRLRGMLSGTSHQFLLGTRFVMQARLVVLSGPDQGRSFPLPLNTTLQTGRVPTAHVFLNDRRVSRIHCKFEVSATEVVVADENSTGGTHVNGQRVTKQPLKHGDTVQIGETVLRFVRDDLGAAETIPPGVVPIRVPALPAERLHELTGTTLAHFEVGPVLGRGLSGLVFRARDTDDGKAVALKVLFADFATDEEEVQRFIRAMKTMMPHKHQHLIGIYNAGKTGPYCWLSMELVEGDSVAKILDMLAGVGTVDWRPALRVAVHVSRALVFAHHHHIIHRNIAPQNILIRASDQVAKLGDLMLAKALEGRLAKQITRPGEVLGDVRYMAPERTQGKETDLRSDIYGLGATVYAMLTGKPPFDGANPVEILTKVRKDEPVRPKLLRPNLPDLLEATVLKMLAKQPAHRHQTAIELLGDLDRVAKLAGVPV